MAVQFLLFSLIFFAPGKLGWQWTPAASTAGHLLGGALILYGVIMLGSGLVNLGRNFQTLPTPKENASLVTNGAYRWVRHPIYSGIILGWIGWGTFRSAELTIILVIVLLVPFFAIKTGREERLLKEAFPEYSDYQKRVRKLIPFLL